jgi:hypothetical protein
MFADDEQPDARASLGMAAGFAGFDQRPETLALPAELSGLVHETVLDLDQWLDAMRVHGGYGGPALSWNGDSLDYSGPGLDWRYEGIITGYLNLWHATSNPAWMGKARQAGEDLLAGQLPSGNFRNSGFDLNPNTGATPHEAAASLGLLKLALALRTLNDDSWSRYYQSALLNIQKYYIQVLWDPRLHTFYDGPAAPSVSPDRLATLAEALFILTRISGESRWIDQYAFYCLDAVQAHQVTEGALKGAIHHRSIQKEKDGRFFPFLIARCLPAMVLGYAWSQDAIYAEAIRRTARFLATLYQEDGSFPQVLYANGAISRWPVWVAPVGDILRALSQASVFGVQFDLLPGLRWVLNGKLENGAIRSGIGFGRALLPPRRNDPRDQVPCCGLVDKAFRFLASIVDPLQFEADCTERMEE